MRKFEVVEVHGDGPHSAYGHEDIIVGQVIELEGPLADKAANNPDFREGAKRGRPKKEAEPETEPQEAE